MTEKTVETAAKLKDFLIDEGYASIDDEISAFGIMGDSKPVQKGSYLTLAGEVTESGEVWNDRYVGMNVGKCGENGGEPTMALVNVPLKRDEIERLGAVAKKDPDSFILSSDVYEAEQKGPGVGYICWPFRNSLVNDMVMNADCEELISSADPDDKCMLLKEGISKLSGQPRPKTWKEKIVGFILDDLVRGTLVGMTFIGGGALLDALFLKGSVRKWIGNKLKNISKNGKNGGAGGAAAGGGAGAAAAAAAGAAAGAGSAEFSRALEQIKNSPGIRVKEPGLNSCWDISLIPVWVVTGQFVGKAVLRGGMAAVGAARGVGALYWNVVWGL